MCLCFIFPSVDSFLIASTLIIEQNRGVRLVISLDINLLSYPISKMDLYIFEL